MWILPSFMASAPAFASTADHSPPVVTVSRWSRECGAARWLRVEAPDEAKLDAASPVEVSLIVEGPQRSASQLAGAFAPGVARGDVGTEVTGTSRAVSCDLVTNICTRSSGAVAGRAPRRGEGSLTVRPADAQDGRQVRTHRYRDQLASRWAEVAR